MRRTWGSASEAALRERCARLDRFHERLDASDGTRIRHRSDGETVYLLEQRRADQDDVTGDIAVHVGRAGELLGAVG